MRKRDVRTFLMVAVLIFLSLLALWVASFSLDRAEEGAVGATAERPSRRLPLTAFLATEAAPVVDEASTAPREPVAVEEEQPQFEPFWHVVESGDTLEKLAIRHYHSPALWRRIHHANLLTIPHPDLLRVGTKLVIPAPSGALITAEEFSALEQVKDRASIPTVAAEDRSLEYVVQPGDTLYDIAEMLYGTPNAWRRIYRLNSGVIDDPDKLKPGTRLYVP